MGDDSTTDEEMLDEAEEFVTETRDALSSTRSISDDIRGQLQRHLNELHHRIEDGDPDAVESKLEETREFIDEHAELRRKSAVREYAESIGLAIVFALILRAFVVEAFKIPTKSMVPTLLVGDHLFVNKFIYGIRVPFTEYFVTRFKEPEKGEVVVFTFPSHEAQRYISKQPPARRDCIDPSTLDGQKDFIKRIVGTAGDTVAIRDNHLIINGEPVQRKFLDKEPTGKYLQPLRVREREVLNGHRYTIRYKGDDQEDDEDGSYDFGPVQVRKGHVFMMGDNRDNSSDSRCWGQVPVEHIKGRALFIWWSIRSNSYWWDCRWGRLGRVIH